VFTEQTLVGAASHYTLCAWNPACPQLAQYNYILVVGAEEKEAGTVNVRTRDNHVHGQHSLERVVEVMQRERAARSLVGLFGEEGSQEAAAAAANGGGDGAAPAPAENGSAA
jgi:threonyl-tRNA synthetase